MDSIKGSICWIAFIEQGDEQGTIRVRLRSRFVPINTVAEQFRGGGHDCACGSTVYNMDEVNALLTMGDETVRKYKETHEDWL
jgi:phosphoesterase RecJ-like protein